MEDTRIIFKTAKLANLKGFDPNIKLKKNSHYNGNTEELDPLGISAAVVNFHYYAATQSLLQTWLRNIHGIHIVMIPTVTSHWTYKTLTVLSERDNDVIKGLKSVSDLPPYDNVCGEDFSTYELALEDALQKSLILIN